MNKQNGYKEGYTETLNSLDYKKYGLLNEYGYNIDRSSKSYHEDDIIKKKCNIKKSSRK